MPEHDALGARADGSCGGHVVHFLEREHLGTHGADNGCEHPDDDGQDDVVQGGTEHGHDGQGQDQAGDRHQGVHHPLERQVNEAARVGAGDAQHEAGGYPDQDAAQADVQGYPGAVQDAGEDVPSDDVRPHGELAAGCEENVAHGGVGVRDRQDGQPGCNGDNNEDEGSDAADRTEWFPASDAHGGVVRGGNCQERIANWRAALCGEVASSHGLLR